MIYQSMSLDLLKQLKKAGFPQNYNLDSGRVICGHCDREYDCEEDENVLVPTPPLSDFIGACGEIYKEKYKFFLIYLYSKDVWLAGYADSNFKQPDELSAGRGDTPRQAVAKLWLKLNA